MGTFSAGGNFDKVKASYDGNNIEFTNSINTVEELRNKLVDIDPHVIIIDYNYDDRKEAVEIICSKLTDCKFVNFNGSTDNLDTNLKEVINLVRKHKDKNKISINDDIKILHIGNKDKTDKFKSNNSQLISNTSKYNMRKNDKKPVIEKEVLKVVTFRSDSIITFISNASTGKSYLSWNLAHALSKMYKVAYINIDESNTASCYFGIDEDREYLPFNDIDRKNLKDIVEEGYRVNKNLIVYTGSFGVKINIKNEVLFKLINQLRSDNNVVIIDTATGFNDNLITAINYSNDIVFVYDLDNAHLKLNEMLLDKIDGNINSNNTIAIINNVVNGSKELNSINKYLKGTSKFKDVLSIRNCGQATYDYMYSSTCNYLQDDNEFSSDIDILIETLKLQGKEKNSSSKKGIFNIFKGGK